MKQIILIISLIIAISNIYATTITVNQDGSADYTQINLAVAESSDGDTIKVYQGTYEGNILLEDRHNLTIASLYHWTEIDSFRYNTIVDGGMENFGFSLELCSDITIQGFTVTKCIGIYPFYSGAGINIRRSAPIVLSDNYIRDNHASWGAGILVASNYPEFPNNVTLTNNTIVKNYANAGAGLFLAQYSQIIMDENSHNSIHSNYASWGADLYWDSNLSATIYIDTMSILENDNNFEPYYFYDREGNCELIVNNYKFELIDNDIYVDVEYGNNNNPGTETDPMQTITHALSRIRSNENNNNTVFLQFGTYSNEGPALPFKSYISLIGLEEEGILLNFANYPIFQNLIYGQNELILLGNEIINLEIINLFSPRLQLVGLSFCNNFMFKNIKCSNINGGFSLFIFWYKDSINSKILLDNVKIETYQDVDLLINISQNLDIKNCSFKNSEYSYWGEGGGKSTMRFAGYEYDPVWPTINIINTEISNNEAANNWPNEFTTDTAIATGYKTNINIINSTITNNRGVPSYYHPGGEYGRAIQFWEKDSHVNIVNSIIYGNDEYDLGYKDPSFYEQNNNYSLNVVNSIVGTHEMDLHDDNISFDNVWSDDPEFVGEEAEYPFALLESSYAIDAGVMNYMDYLPEDFEFPTTDLAGNPRISGGVIDLGAYEYQQASSAPEEEVYEAPTGIAITNYPNPGRIKFSGKTVTKISLSLPKDGKYKLDIYNIKGQKIRSILDAFLARGKHSYAWNGRDNIGRIVSSGTYLVKCELDGKLMTTNKMTVVK